LFLDADGRLSELLTRLNIKTSKVKPGGKLAAGRSDGLALVVTNTTTLDEAIRALEGRVRTPTKVLRAKRPKKVNRPAEVSATLFAQATETFGSGQTARRWLSSECGALNNRTPLKVIRESGNEAEVERILSCIDYGMIA